MQAFNSHDSLDLQDWLSTALGIPNLLSDVLVILDCYWAGLAEENSEAIQYLQDNDWARYGILFAGYDDELYPLGRFSEYLIGVLQVLTQSVNKPDTLVNCGKILADVSRVMKLSEENACPDWRGNSRLDSFILAPI